MERVISWSKTPRSYCTVEPALFLFTFASFLSYPVYQQLLYYTFCQGSPNCTATNDTNCHLTTNPTVLKYQEHTSHWILYTNLANGLPAILVSPIYGSLSDVHGRKPFIILPAIGSMINTMIIITVQYVAKNMIYLYLLGAAISGITGGFFAFNLSVYSYVADNSSHGNRTRRMGWLEGMTFFGATLSSLVSGIWIRYQGFGIPFFGVLACQVSVIFYVILFLPPPRVNGKPIDGSCHISLSNLKTATVIVATKLWLFLKLVFQSWRIMILIMSFFLVEINFLGITDIVVLYCKTKLCWNSDFIGYFLAGKSFFNGLAVVLILPVLTWIKINDNLILIIGLIAGAAALITMGVATQTWIMFLAVIIGCMRGSVVPVIRATLSKLTSIDQQGVMFSGLSVIEALCILVASSIYNALYPVTYKVYPGFCFFIMALCLGFLLPFIFSIYCSKPSVPNEVSKENESLLSQKPNT